MSDDKRLTEILIGQLIKEHRMIDASGGYKQQESVPQEFKDSGQRTEPATIAEKLSGSDNIPTTQQNIINNSFMSIKDTLLSDPNVDNETIINLHKIEQYLTDLLSKRATQNNNNAFNKL